MSKLPKIPAGWTWAKVRDVGQVKLGRQRSPQHHSGKHMRPYLRVANVYDARIDLCDVMEMNFTPEEYETFRLEPGDVLLNEGQSLEWVGRAAIYRGDPKGACFQNTLIRFRAGPRVLPEFALLVFRHYVYSQRFRRIARWTTNIAHLGSDRFAEVEFPVPPIREQQRIVACADEQFTRLDAGVAALERLRAHLRRYRAAVLVQLTRGWDHVPLGDLLREPLCNGKSAKGSASPPGLPVLRLNAMTPDGFDYSFIRYAPLAWDDYKDIGVSEGDFFVSRGNGTRALVGRGTLAQMPPMRIIFPDTMIRVRLRPELQETRWIPTIWSSRVIREQIEAKAKTTAGIWKISQGDLASVSVPLPPAAKQREFVDIAAGEFSGVIQQEAAIERAIARAARLRASILRAAFEGRLVDPEQPARAPAA